MKSIPECFEVTQPTSSRPASSATSGEPLDFQSRVGLSSTAKIQLQPNEIERAKRAHNRSAGCCNRQVATLRDALVDDEVMLVLSNHLAALLAWLKVRIEAHVYLVRALRPSFRPVRVFSSDVNIAVEDPGCYR